MKEVLPFSSSFNPFWRMISVSVSMLEVASSRIRIFGTGEGNELSLSGGQAASPLINLRVVTVFHLHDKVMGTDRLSRADDILVCGGTVSVADVIHDRAGEDEAVLHHDAHLGTQGVERHLRNIHAVNGDPSASDIVEAA